VAITREETTMTAETKDDLPPWDQKLATLDEMFLGNAEAIRFMETISIWTHLYDDLIDQDKEIDQEFVHEVMWKVMVGLPMNQFYIQNANLLAPIVATGILNWRGANEMEQQGCVEELHISHVTRYSINDLALMVMVLVGGAAHAARFARDARLAFQRDTFAHYLKERNHV
jgi:hypothetical protein